MRKNTIDNVRLGVFIIAGLLILVVSLYLIGQNQHFFGSNFSLKARFPNVNGLLPGNNVRFAGIQCGTVRDIEIVNDTTIEVSMIISRKTSRYVRSDARVAIGSEGLMGNKVINIFPGTTNAPAITDGGMLRSGGEKSFDDLLGTLSVTGENAYAISSDLKQTAEKINNSPLVRDLLADTSVSRDLRRTLQNLRDASGDIKTAAAALNIIIFDMQEGKGVAGLLLTDKHAAAQASEAIDHLSSAAANANQLTAGLDSIVSGIRTDMNAGKGTLHLLLRDSLFVSGVQNSLQNIKQGTKAFNEDMEALKHNFLFRGYFKKQERKKSKEQAAAD